MDDLWEEGEVTEEDQPELVAKEVGKGEIEEEAEIELDVEGGKLFPKELGVFDIGDVVTAPHQEQHFHVEYYEKHDVGQGRQNEVEVAALSEITLT